MTAMGFFFRSVTQSILAKVAKTLVSAGRYFRKDDFPSNASSNLREVEQLLAAFVTFRGFRDPGACLISALPKRIIWV
jgi:hypothetical protein